MQIGVVRMAERKVKEAMSVWESCVERLHDMGGAGPAAILMEAESEHRLGLAAMSEGSAERAAQHWMKVLSLSASFDYGAGSPSCSPAAAPTFVGPPLLGVEDLPAAMGTAMNRTLLGLARTFSRLLDRESALLLAQKALHGLETLKDTANAAKARNLVQELQNERIAEEGAAQDEDDWWKVESDGNDESEESREHDGSDATSSFSELLRPSLHSEGAVEREEGIPSRFRLSFKSSDNAVRIVK